MQCVQQDRDSRRQAKQDTCNVCNKTGTVDGKQNRIHAMCATGRVQWMGSKTGYMQHVQQDRDSGWELKQDTSNVCNRTGTVDGKQNRIHAMCATGQGQWMGSKTGYTQCVQQDGDSGWEVKQVTYNVCSRTGTVDGKQNRIHAMCATGRRQWMGSNVCSRTSPDSILQWHCSGRRSVAMRG